MSQLLQLARSLGPYLLIELLLPGGSIIAAVLWLLQHRHPRPAPGNGAAVYSRAPWGDDASRGAKTSG